MWCERVRRTNGTDLRTITNPPIKLQPAGASECVHLSPSIIVVVGIWVVWHLALIVLSLTEESYKVSLSLLLVHSLPPPRPVTAGAAQKIVDV